MPIRGLTDATSRSFGSGFARIGRLYKGGERSEEDIQKKRPGRDLKHFRVEFEEPYAHLEDDFVAMYGESPTQFARVFLTAPTVDEVFPTWMEEWGKTGLVHRCDGAEQVKWFDSDLGRCSPVPKPCAQPACKCKQVGRINLMFADFIENTGALGYFSLSTHSVYDILELTNLLSDIQRIYGTVLGVPFVLGRAEKEVVVPKFDKEGKPTGERMKVKKSLLFIRPDEDFTRARLLPALAAPAALPAPEIEITPEYTASARKKLGSGGGPRRIGTEPKAVIEAPSSWINEPGVLDKFLAWAQDKFQMDSNDVAEALLAAGADFADIRYFTGSKFEAIAAVVAGYCEYDRAKIASVTNNKTLFKESEGFEVHTLAVEIVERIEEEYA